MGKLRGPNLFIVRYLVNFRPVIILLCTIIVRITATVSLMPHLTQSCTFSETLTLPLALSPNHRQKCHFDILHYDCRAPRWPALICSFSRSNRTHTRTYTTRTHITLHYNTLSHRHTRKHIHHRVQFLRSICSRFFN